MQCFHSNEFVQCNDLPNDHKTRFSRTRVRDDFTAVGMWLRNRCKYRTGIKASRAVAIWTGVLTINDFMEARLMGLSDYFRRREYSARSILLSAPRIMFSFLRSLPPTVTLDRYVPGNQLTTKLAWWQTDDSSTRDHPYFNKSNQLFWQRSNRW